MCYIVLGYTSLATSGMVRNREHTSNSARPTTRGGTHLAPKLSRTDSAPSPTRFPVPPGAHAHAIGREIEWNAARCDQLRNNNRLSAAPTVTGSAGCVSAATGSQSRRAERDSVNLPPHPGIPARPGRADAPRTTLVTPSTQVRRRKAGHIRMTCRRLFVQDTPRSAEVCQCFDVRFGRDDNGYWSTAAVAYGSLAPGLGLLAVVCGGAVTDATAAPFGKRCLRSVARICCNAAAMDSRTSFAG